MKNKLKLAICAVLLSTAVHAQSLLREVQFDIPAQDLSQAAVIFSEQSGIQVVMAGENIAKLRTPRIEGRLPISDALQKLLSETGFTYKSIGNDTVALIGPASTSSLLDSNNDGNASSASEDAESQLTSAERWKQSLALRENYTVAQADGRGDSANPSSSDTNDRSEQRLEEVIVTARKVKERIQDVPMTITAITGEQLENLGAVDIKDIIRSIPGVSFTGTERGLSRYTIRGITSQHAPTTGIYLDDFSLLAAEGGFQGAFDAILFDIARLEVLKGPQGTLFGGSAMGGAIRYVSNAPDLSGVSGSVASNGSFTAHGEESYGAQAVLNVPLSDEVAIRGGIYYAREGGYVDNIANLDVEDTHYSATPYPTYTPLTQPSLSTRTEDDHNNAETYAARLSLLWQPDPTLTITPAILYQDYQSENTGQFFTNQPGLVSSFRLAEPTHDYGGLYSLTVVKEWNGLEFTSLTGRLDRSTNWTRDFSFFIGGIISPFYPFDSIARYKTRYETFSQEFRVGSAPGDDSPLRWVAGVFYRTQDWSFPSAAYFEDAADGLATAIFGNVATGGIFDPATNEAFGANTTGTRKEQALFGEATYSLTDALSVTAGVRLFKLSEDGRAAQRGPFNGGTSVLETETSEEGISPRVGLSYQLGKDHLLYASAAQGFRVGGYAGTPFAGCASDLALLGLTSWPESYKSDSLWTYELGSKNEFAGGRIVANGSIFYSDWSDLQQFVSLPSCGGGVTVNTGQARVQGVELETRMQLTEEFQIGGNVTYTDAQITDPGTFSVVPEGVRVLNTPEWMASAFVSYETPLTSLWNLELRADYQYRDEQLRNYITVQNVSFPGGSCPFPAGCSVPNAALSQEGYDVLSGYAALRRGPTTLRFFINNALDARPIVDYDLTSGSSKATTLRPRTIGLELRQQF